MPADRGPIQEQSLINLIIAVPALRLDSGTEQPMNTKIQLSDHFTYRRLLRFVLPSIVMMIFTSIYGVVDGLFVSNFVGKTPFAAVNLIMPFLMMLGCLGFMIGTGGSAIVAMTLGEGKKDLANAYFSMMVYVTIAAGILLAILGIITVPAVSVMLGAQGEMLSHCILYGRILLPAVPAFMLQNVFQSFLVTAEKPQLGLAVTVGAGLTNIILDALLVAVFPMGIVGAALATTISQRVGGLVPLVYFCKSSSGLLHLGRPCFYGKILVKTCLNGSSELMTNLSMSLVNILYNFQLMRFAGEDGIAAYGVIMYVNFIFIAMFVGYSIGSAPLTGYHYGAHGLDEVRNLLHKSLVITGTAGVVLTGLAEILAFPLARIFVGYDPELYAMTGRGFMIYSLSFLIMGFNIYGSAYFTSLGNGAVSAAISFLRTLLFQVVAVMGLPFLIGLDGIWLAIVAAELPALAVTGYFFVSTRKRYFPAFPAP